MGTPFASHLAEPVVLGFIVVGLQVRVHVPVTGTTLVHGPGAFVLTACWAVGGGHMHCGALVGSNAGVNFLRWEGPRK